MVPFPHGRRFLSNIGGTTDRGAEGAEVERQSHKHVYEIESICNKSIKKATPLQKILADQWLSGGPGQRN